MASPAPFNARELIQNLPNLPGVYRMIAADDTVLYVGKARDLQKRVGSYFQKNDHSPRITLMLSQVHHIDTTVTRSEAEALILENNLIKALSPKYNILFRDDKSYPYIKISQHAAPQLAYYRGNLDKKHQFFGPFPNAYAVTQTIQLLQKVFLLRTCEDSVYSHRSRPCLLYQIKRCSAPCVDFISPEAYQQSVHQATLFLQGKQSDLLDDLQSKMQAAALNLEFEQAAHYRDQLQALAKVQEKQFVSSNTGDLDADVIACVIEQGLCCINLTMIRNGQHLGDKHLFPLQSEDCTPSRVIEAFIVQHYLLHPCPPLLLLSHPLEDTSIAPFLQAQAARKVNLNHNPNGERKVWLTMALKNATLAIGQKQQQHTTQTQRLQALQQALDLPDTTQRIECFDISHTMGEATVASCVVYDRAQMQPKEYRHYNITGITGGDDYAAMRDVLTRRYQKMAAGEGVLPDLILIDGGKGQIGVAVEVMAEVGLSHIPLVGVAKGVERKAGLETLILPYTGQNIHLPNNHLGLHLIQQIRDEAHRFAITGHRARRGKARTQSRLDDIKGIGAKRRKALITRFGSVKGIQNASADDIAQVEGISAALAHSIYEQLHS